MNTLFIANTELNENEGIYKKIVSQAKGLKNANDDGWLITKSGKGSKIYDFQNDSNNTCEIDVLNMAKKIIERNDVGIVYVRHMLPSIKLIRFLNWMKKNKLFIFYEIPTYPYYAEQYRVSERKYRAIAKLALDTVFWPLIYKYITKLVVIKSNSKAKMYSKMIEITNGADTRSIESKKCNENKSKSISMVAVGTIYPYHGYDRILEGLKRYSSKPDSVPVEFHIIGSSKTIDKLKEYAEKLFLSNVFFHGVKNTDELNEMYSNYDIGVGSVALFRRNADIDTTIKIIEYYCRGVVVLTSGISPMDKYDADFTIHISNDEKPIDIGEIIEKYNSIPSYKINQISNVGKSNFSWDFIMKNLCDSSLNGVKS